MIGRFAISSLPSITVRLSAEEKARFAALARTRGLSESALALSAIRSMVGTGEPDRQLVDPQEPAKDRITIRLRPGDGNAIARRAAPRGMKPSGYLAALVRGHVAANPPVTANELSALKIGISVLAGLGTVLSQTARNPALGATGLEALRLDISRTRAAVAELEQRTHDLVRTALISWESRSG